MKRSDAFPSQFMGQDDCDPPVLATIKSVAMEPVKGEHGEEMKPVIRFYHDLKPWIVNSGNWMSIEDAYGPDSDGWTGKTIELYRDPNVMFGTKKVGGVRVRIPQQAPANGNRPFNGNVPAGLTLQQAIDKCALAGIDKSELVEHFKSKGITAYNIARDTPTVLAFIESRQQAVGGGADTEESIPFAPDFSACMV